MNYEVERAIVQMKNILVKKVDRVDWERRRYEVARDIFPFACELTTGILRMGQEVEGSAGKTVMQVCADTAVNYADALIERLRETAD